MNPVGGGSVPFRFYRALVCLLMAGSAAWGSDWPQYRGPATDGTTPDLIATTWDTSRSGFLVWTNASLTNGFSSFAVSQGRAFTLISSNDGSGLLEYCVAVDAATGANLWATPIGPAPWDPNTSSSITGGAGTSPYNRGDGPRTTPSVQGGRVFALSGFLNLVCMEAGSGSVIWTNDLIALYGASVLDWQNGASPCLDNDLIFVSLNSSSNIWNLAAFRTSDGGLQWSSQLNAATYATPVVATIDGVRQVVFATYTSLVSLDRSTGARLWEFIYPFGTAGTAMAASPVIHSNIVYCTCAYGKGAGAARVALSNGSWTVTQLYRQTAETYQSVWMTPVCYQGYLYTLCGRSTASPDMPLNCIELSTGALMWSTNSFGKGGLILVNTNLLVLTETGQLVLVDPNPAAYTERARYQAFQFTADAPGKCWNNPAFSNGRIYARGTRGAVCLDVPASPLIPPLKLLAPQFLNSTQVQIFVGTADGSPIPADRLAGIEVRATNSLESAPATWPKLTNQLVLSTNGFASLTNTVYPSKSQGYYRATEPP